MSARLTLSLVVATTACVQGSFVEPIDPFAPQTLEADPYVLALDTDDDNPGCRLTLLTNHENVEAIDGGLRILGSLFYENPAAEDGHFVVSRGEFIARLDAQAGTVESIDGFGTIDIPAIGPLSNFVMDEVMGGGFGYARGDHDALADFRGLNPALCYFYIDASGTALGSILGTGLSFGTFAMDPSDPYVVVNASMDGLPLGPLDEVTFGFSAHGQVPFNPHVTVYPRIQPFAGHLYLGGVLPLQKVPVALDGEAVIDIGVGADVTFFERASDDAFNLGFNGVGYLSHDVLDLLPLEMEIEMGAATMEVNVASGGDTAVHFAGVRERPPSGTDEFLADSLGDYGSFVSSLLPRSSETLYGTVSDDVSQTLLGFLMTSDIGFGEIALRLNPFWLELSPRGLNLSGRLSFLGQSFSVSGSAQTNGNFSLTGSLDLGHGGSSGEASYDVYLDVDITFELKGGLPAISADVDAGGEVCLGECVGISASPSVSFDFADREMDVSLDIPIVGDISFSFDF